MILKNFRSAVADVPEIADRARSSLDNLDGGVRRANATMAILATVAVLALGVAVLALVQVRANSAVVADLR